MAANETGVPIVPHEVATGAECCGCLVVRTFGNQAHLTCNECGTVVRTVPAESARAVMLELATAEICSARCPHCGALNTFFGFSAIEAFICAECGEGVALKTSLQ